jgi:hypothetical protein
MKTGIEIFEEDSRILESIAAKYGENSREYAALAHAALALLHAITEKDHKFMENVIAPESGLTNEQRNRLIAMGIDPDSELG